MSADAVVPTASSPAHDTGEEGTLRRDPSPATLPSSDRFREGDVPDAGGALPDGA
ncbi:MAG TPA: hypothetical protein VGK67_04605 [Myxococcales bacterium]|jgi:hypothetical protein